MDPLACWTMLLNHWDEGRTEDVAESLDALVAWLRSGGFHPAPVPSIEFLLRIRRVVVA